MPVFDFSDRHIKFLESRVQFLLTTAVSKISPHLFPLAEDIWGRQSQKAKNRQELSSKAAEFLPVKR